MPKLITRWADCVEGSNRVEVRDYAASRGHARASGRSFMIISCPFCGANVKAFIWSIRGGGKRCDCGAMHSWIGHTYRIKAEAV